MRYINVKTQQGVVRISVELFDKYLIDPSSES